MAGAVDGADATNTPRMIRDRSAKSDKYDYLPATLRSVPDLLRYRLLIVQDSSGFTALIV